MKAKKPNAGDASGVRSLGRSSGRVYTASRGTDRTNGRNGLKTMNGPDPERPVQLMTADGEPVAQLIAAGLFESDGRLPNVIEYEGRTFERGWTNDGNTDADERLWFEVQKVNL